MGRRKTTTGRSTSTFGDNIHRYDYLIKVETILGRKLPKEAVVHHVDGDPTNNENSNLVVCENQRYHMVLHARQKALADGVDPNKEKRCPACKEIKLFNEFYTQKKGRRLGNPSSRCKSCCSTLDKLRVRPKDERGRYISNVLQK